MEDKAAFEVVNQEVQREDCILIADEAALADDRLIAELFRVPPLPITGVGQAKCILPYAVNGPYQIYNPPNEATVQQAGTFNASLWVNPFRAIIGSRAPPGDAKQNWRDARSAIAVGTFGNGHNRQKVQLAATASNHRWDLIYARVDVDVASVLDTRFVRTSKDSAVATSNLVVRRSTTVTLGVVAGAEGAVPTKPALPSDGAGAFYIQLAYVRLQHPFTLTSRIDFANIQECAPIYQLAHSTGAVTAAPASEQYREGGTVLTATPWGNSFAGRPNAYLPPTMIGGKQVMVALDFTGGTASHPLNAVSLVDGAIDWRARSLLWFAQSGEGLSWRTSNPGGGGTVTPGSFGVPASKRTWGTGQSFGSDVLSGGSTDGFTAPVPGGVMLVAQLNPSELASMAVGSEVVLFVDLNTGELKAAVSSTSPSCSLFVTLLASGSFGNG